MSRILVVDDDFALRGLIEMMLVRSGHSVVAAENGRDALEQCRLSLPDVILTDLVMPELDGFGLIQSARREFPGLPIVAMSGGLPDSDRSLALAQALGACRTLPKPFTLVELRDALESAIALGVGSRSPFPESATASLGDCAFA